KLKRLPKIPTTPAQKRRYVAGTAAICDEIAEEANAALPRFRAYQPANGHEAKAKPFVLKWLRDYAAANQANARYERDELTDASQAVKNRDGQALSHWAGAALEAFAAVMERLPR